MGHLRVAFVLLVTACGRLGFEGVPAGGGSASGPDIDAPAMVAGPTTVGLVAYWSFDTSIADTVGTNDATCTNCPASGPGVAGNAQVFTGSECLSVTSMQSWSAPTFTLSAWIQAPAMTGPVMVHESSSGCPSPELSVTNGLGLTQLNNVGTHNEAWTPVAIAQPDAWHHVAVTWDGTTQEVFLDGQCACNAAPTSLPADNVQPFTIGCYPGAGTMFTGSIDEVRIYNRALSHADVAGLYAVGGLVAPTPIACAIACASAPP
jgi:hypothetical protein